VKQNASLLAMRPPGAISELTRQAMQPAEMPAVPAPAQAPTIEATMPPVLLASTEPPAAIAERKSFWGRREQNPPKETKKPSPQADPGATLYLDEVVKPKPVAVETAAPAKPKRGWFNGTEETKPASTAPKTAPATKPAPIVAATPPKTLPAAAPAAAPAVKPQPTTTGLLPPPARVPPPGKRGMPAGGMRPISPTVPGAPPVRMTLAPAGGTLYAR
ncbi:MAG: hypothetical protein LDL31_11385, partial [Prosthecobacter sp.]|nr:hypothetical protein [Prosthecobacter sp.]